MRKLIYVAIIIVLLGACDEDPFYYHTATNHSLSETVFVTFRNGVEEVILAPGESKKVSLQKGSNVHTGIKQYSPEKRIIAVYQSSLGICEFFDRPSFEVRILNLSGKAGVLVAGDWMGVINFSDSNSVQSDLNWLIYTANPTFSAVTNDGFPLSVSVVRDSDVFKITILTSS
jgi:hypothetical protein